MMAGLFAELVLRTHKKGAPVDVVIKFVVRKGRRARVAAILWGHRIERVNEIHGQLQLRGPLVVPTDICRRPWRQRSGPGSTVPVYGRKIVRRAAITVDVERGAPCTGTPWHGGIGLGFKV